MKKIGILTYHRSYNYGAFMQAYSLSMRLQRDLKDCRVEIIDYNSDNAIRSYRGKRSDYFIMSLKAQSIRKKLSYGKYFIKSIFSKKKITGDKRKQLFEDALKELPLSMNLIITDNCSKVFKKIKDEYDVVVVGSDAVWNWQIRIFPTPYFLGEDIGAVKMSYAASSYGQDYHKASKAQIKYITKALNDFNYIGVRDETTEDLIKELLPNETPHHNCDPTVFLDMKTLPVSARSVYEKISGHGIDLEKPIICIMGDDWLGKILRDSIGNQYQIVSVFNNNRCSDVYIDDLNPFEWAIAFSFFRLTVTHFFHGNLLSLKNGVPTLIIEQHNEYNSKYNSKIRDFMNRIDLLSNCYYIDEVNAETLRPRINELMNNPSVLVEKIGNEIMKEEKYYLDFEKSLESVISGEKTEK